MSKEEKRIKKEEKKKLKEEKKNQPKKKLKKLPIIIIVISLILILGSIGYYIYYYKTTLKDISSHYNTFVITTKKTNIYDKNNKKIGTIEKNTNIELTKVKIDNINTKYFNIKDTNYYINYKNIKKSKKQEPPKINEKYLILNYNVTTKNKTELYKEDKLILKVKEKINLPIQYMDQNNYYVSYLNDIYAIRKDSSEAVENKNTEEQEATHVSVIYYYDIEDTCNNYNCTKTEDVKTQINKLKESGYYTLTTDEFKNYIEGNVRLKDKAIYIITSNETDITNAIKNELQIILEKDDGTLKFNSNNKTAIPGQAQEINRYQIKSYTPIENLLKMANGEDVEEHDPTPPSDQGIAVLNYHFFYDPNQGETCNEGICLTTDKFREHLQYFKDNGFKTLTMNEFMRWMYGEIELPEKSVLITVDDGAMGTGRHNGNKLIPLLEEYDMHATLFLITGWWDIENYRSPNLDIQSHTNDMHQYGSCGRGQLVCYSYEDAKADLQQSANTVGNTDSFCYPFYSYSDTAIQAVKDVGFKIAFAGGSRKATRKSNKYIIPRYPIHSGVTLDQIKAMVN